MNQNYVKNWENDSSFSVIYNVCIVCIQIYIKYLLYGIIFRIIYIKNQKYTKMHSKFLVKTFLVEINLKHPGAMYKNN